MPSIPRAPAEREKENGVGILRHNSEHIKDYTMDLMTVYEYKLFYLYHMQV